MKSIILLILLCLCCGLTNELEEIRVLQLKLDEYKDLPKIYTGDGSAWSSNQLKRLEGYYAERDTISSNINRLKLEKVK